MDDKRLITYTRSAKQNVVHVGSDVRLGVYWLGTLDSSRLVALRIC